MTYIFLTVGILCLLYCAGIRSFRFLVFPDLGSGRRGLYGTGLDVEK